MTLSAFLKKPASLLWFWVPVLGLLLQIALEAFLPHDVFMDFIAEGGPHENLQCAVMVAAFIVALRILFENYSRMSKGLLLWIGTAAAASFYVAGEEISWGQHLFHWVTPEYWATVNDQNETNLHNTSSWLDQKPKLLLALGIVVGGLVIPALRRWRPGWLPAKFATIYPPDAIATTALIFFALKLSNYVTNALDIRLFERISEIQELYMFYFVLLYLLDFHRRMRSGAALRL